MPFDMLTSRNRRQASDLRMERDRHYTLDERCESVDQDVDDVTNSRVVVAIIHRAPSPLNVSELGPCRTAGRR